MDIPIEHLFALLDKEPGSGLAQTILLFLIWINSRGLKKELISLKEALTKMEISHEIRIGNLEESQKNLDQRLSLVEKH